MSTLKVDGIRHNNATSDAITTHSDGTASAKIVDVGGSQLSNRNLQVNGAMIIAQKATTDTGSEGLATVDKFGLSTGGEDEDLTQAQVDVASGTTPFSLGFRKAYKITNGNQTSGAGADDRAIVHTTYESQDIANSGWNYTSSTGFITLSYWAKSSVAQTFYLALTTHDGSSYRYASPITFTSADTWTKFTHKIPGNSNLQFDQDAGRGLQMYWTLFRGTNTTDNSFTINQWAAYNGSIRYPDITSTWWTTNDSTFELTGVQFEVGEIATSFEHRSRGDELARCQRYCVVYGSDQEMHLGTANAYNSTNINLSIHVPVSMRAKPNASVVLATSGDNANKWLQAYMGATGVKSNASISVSDCSEGHAQMRLYLQNAHSGLSVGQALWCHTLPDAKLILAADSF